MGKVADIKFPAGINWRIWIERWDRMQDYYIARRAERFELMVRLIADTQEVVSRVLDIGCGTGSLMLPILERFPKADVYGIDFDATLLPLAEKRLAKFGKRVHLIHADIRDESWTKLIPAPINAAVSATALHWLSKEQLARFYSQLAKVLCQGGIFLNADHVGSKSPSIQKGREQHSSRRRPKPEQDREKMLNPQRENIADDWEGFWDAYGRALMIDIKEYRKKLTEPWEGSEEGLPLQWHFEKLTESGFKAVDCFWRCDCDAIYGGIL